MFGFNRERRHGTPIFPGQPQYHFYHYSTDSKTSEIKNKFGEDISIEKLKKLPDPLKKNLADTLVSTNSNSASEMPVDTDLLMNNIHQVHIMPTHTDKTSITEPPNLNMTFYQSLSGITNFFSGAFNIISKAMSNKPPKPAIEYDTEFEFIHEGSPSLVWQFASISDENKSEQALPGAFNMFNGSKISLNEPKPSIFESSSSDDSFQDAVSNGICERLVQNCFDMWQNQEVDNVSKMKTDLNFDNEKNNMSSSIVNSLEDSFEDAVCLDGDSPNDFVEVYSFTNLETEVPNINNLSLDDKKENSIEDNGSIISTGISDRTIDNKIKEEQKQEIVLSCEDKMERLKLLLKNKKVKVHSSEIVKNNSSQNIDIRTTSVIDKNSKAFQNEDMAQKVEVTSNNMLNHQNLPEMMVTHRESSPPILIPDLKNNKEVISSCEDKMNRLKSLLDRRKEAKDSMFQPQTKSSLNSIENRLEHPSKSSLNSNEDDERPSKFFHSPKRYSDNMSFPIQLSDDSDSSSVEDLEVLVPRYRLEIADSDISGSFTDHDDCFDEIAGRFRRDSTDSDDSFQIVFSDSPSTPEEDNTFVVNDQDSCYGSNPLEKVDTETSESECSDTESDYSSDDSGCGKLFKTKNLSRTLPDLTDIALYEDRTPDEVDFAVKNVLIKVPIDKISEKEVKINAERHGLLKDDDKRQSRKDQPAKKVHFSSKPPKVHMMHVWSYAAKQARKGEWENYARDRDRFRRRIDNVEMAISWVLKPQHRTRVMFQRFRPYWNRLEREEKMRNEAELKKSHETSDNETLKPYDAQNNINKERNKVKSTEEQAKVITVNEKDSNRNDSTDPVIDLQEEENINDATSLDTLNGSFNKVKDSEADLIDKTDRKTAEYNKEVIENETRCKKDTEINRKPVENGENIDDLKEENVKSDELKQKIKITCDIKEKKGKFEELTEKLEVTEEEYVTEEVIVVIKEGINTRGNRNTDKIVNINTECNRAP